MTDSLVPPIIIVDGLDVTIYPAVDAAEQSLEAWIVEEHPEVIGFDALGRRLTFRVWCTPSGSRLGRALGLRREGVLVAAQDGAPVPEALHAALRAYLQAVAPAWRPPEPGPRTAAEYAASLPALLAAASSAGAGR